MAYRYHRRRRYGEENDNRRGNKPLRTRTNKSGYKQFYNEEEGRWEYTHRCVAEKKMGGEIRPDYEIHHKNRDVTDNRPENLVALSREDHRRVHQIDREIEALEERAQYASYWKRRKIRAVINRLLDEQAWIENQDLRKGSRFHTQRGRGRW